MPSFCTRVTNPNFNTTTNTERDRERERERARETYGEVTLDIEPSDDGLQIELHQIIWHHLLQPRPQLPEDKLW
jgi:hypothetical protein